MWRTRNSTTKNFLQTNQRDSKFSILKKNLIFKLLKNPTCNSPIWRCPVRLPRSWGKPWALRESELGETDRRTGRPPRVLSRSPTAASRWNSEPPEIVSLKKTIQDMFQTFHISNFIDLNNSCILRVDIRNNRMFQKTRYFELSWLRLIMIKVQTWVSPKYLDVLNFPYYEFSFRWSFITKLTW